MGTYIAFCAFYVIFIVKDKPKGEIKQIQSDFNPKPINENPNFNTSFVDETDNGTIVWNVNNK